MYAWAIFIHLIFAAFWLGGMLFTAAVLVPATRKKLASQRGMLFTELGTRFSRLSWVAFPILILTGVTALLGKGYSWPYLLSSPFWESIYGSRLAWKLSFFGLMLIVSGVHDFWLGPKASLLMEREPGKKSTERYRKATSWVGRINLVLGLAILYFAVRLVRF